MRKNKYYVHKDGFFDTNAKFVSYSFRTKKILTNFANGTTAPSFHTDYKVIEQFVKSGEWKRLTYKEAMDLLKHPLPKNDDIYYYTTTKNCDIVFVACNKRNRQTDVYFNSGKVVRQDDYVRGGRWTQITKEKAESLIKKIWEDQKYNKFKFKDVEANCIYYTHSDKFSDDTLFLSYNCTTKKMYRHVSKYYISDFNVDTEFSKYKTTFEFAEGAVMDGVWKHISEKDANKLLEKDKIEH